LMPLTYDPSILRSVLTDILGISEEEITRKVAKKKDEMKEMISEENALLVVAKELGGLTYYDHHALTLFSETLSLISERLVKLEAALKEKEKTTTVIHKAILEHGAGEIARLFMEALLKNSLETLFSDK